MTSPKWLQGRRALKTLAVTAVVGTLIAGCTAGGDGTGSTGSGDRSLVIAHPADPASLYGNFHTVQRDINISEQITEKLVELSADGDVIEPRLAESWTVEGNTVVLTLREGVTFTNGEVFNAESAIFSLNTMLEAEVYKSFTDAIDHVELRDDNTVAVVGQGSPDLALLSLALGSFQYPPKYFTEVNSEGFSDSPIGTGPYLFEKWTKGVSVELTANPDYWGGAPYYTDVEFRIMVDPSAQVAALLAGEVDLVTDLPRGSVGQIEGSDAAKIESRPSNRLFFMSFNTIDEGPLQNPLVRRAIAHAIDTQVVTDTGVAGYGIPLNGQILSESWTGYDPNAKPIEYDPKKAKALLAEAGYADGLTLPLEYSVSQQKDVWPVVAEQLAAVGINVELELMEPGTFIQAFVAKEMKGLFAQAVLPPPDAHFMYQRHRDGAVTSYFSSEKVDALVAEGMTVMDTAERLNVYAELTKEFQKNPPFVPLFQGEDLYGVSAALSGFTPTASQFLDIGRWGK